MLKSMTAFGRASVTSEIGKCSVEIHSVNRKHLEINLFLPRELQRFEPEIRKILGTKINRGQVTVKLFAILEKSSPIVVKANLPLVRQMKCAFDSIAQEFQIPEAIVFEMLARQEDLLSFSEEIVDEQVYWSTISEVISQALESFMQMRLREGAALQSDIACRFDYLNEYIEKVAQHAPNATVRYRQKLIERINDLVPGTVEHDERILKEISLFAERIDITEEIIRFRSHLNQCHKLLGDSSGQVGKTFEFILQELVREVNTIGSKSSDIEVSRLVIQIKSELEKIREQIQNVE